MNLWKVYAIPRIVYGLEVMAITNKDYDQLEVMQRKLLRQLQGLPNSTSNTAVYVLIGAIPIRMIVERNLLALFMSIVRNPQSIEHVILTRQMYMDNPDGAAFLCKVQQTLEKYTLKSVGEYFDKPLGKNEWKTEIRKAQGNFWYEKCKEDQSTKKSTTYLQIQRNASFHAHNIWSSVGNSLDDVKAGEIKVRLVTQSYMVQSLKAKHDKKVSPLCCLCGKDNETIAHFLLSCEKLHEVRCRHLLKIKQYLENIRKGLFLSIENDGNLLQLILDCTHSRMDYRVRMKLKSYRGIETLTRKLCMDLHKCRVSQMAGKGL